VIVIRQAEVATPEVVEAVARLMPQLLPALPPPTHDDVATVIESPATRLLLAHDGEAGPIVGTATLVLYRTPSRIHARLENVVVDEPARGRGAGEALTREAVRLAREAGASVIELNSNPRREAANRLYRRLGFELHETNNYWIRF